MLRFGNVMIYKVSCSCLAEPPRPVNTLVSSVLHSHSSCLDLYVVRCCAVRHCTVRYYYGTVLYYCTVLYCAVLHCTVRYYYCMVLYYCTVLYCAILHCTVRYCTILYSSCLFSVFGTRIEATHIYYYKRVSAQ